MADTERKLGIVFASAEAAPFVKTGGLGDVAGSLPAALARAGADVIVMVPKYATISDAYKSQMEHLCDFYVPLGWRNEYCGLERLVKDGVTYLFVDNERYFDRGYPYGFFDDGERFAFFSKAVCESLQHLPAGFTCDILHCNDWHTALAPVFLREFYQGLPLYENVKTIFSIHNIAFQGQFTDKLMADILGLAHIPAAARQLRCDDASINYMMGALNYADAITTVSPTYAEEIKTPAFGEHLDGVLRRRSEALQGILNGIDTKHFDPATDPEIAANYTADDLSGKAACKRALQEELGLEVRDDRPLMVMVTRLTRQKGLDLVTYALDRILSGGVQVAVLGTGEAAYENAMRYFEGRYPGQMAARIEFDPALSQRMYAGADLFLMPSLFEPCGLSQMIAMRYGTLPVVRETGGLKDTVEPYNYVTGDGTGFSFANFNGDEMGDAVFRGARLFWDDRAAFDRLVRQAMAQDFSWKGSAEKYLDLYCWLHPELPRPKGEDEDAEAEEPLAEEASKGEEPVAEAAEKPEEAEPVAEVKPKAAAKPAAETVKPTKAEPTRTKATPVKAASEAATTPKPAETAAKPAATKAAPEKAAKPATAKAAAKPAAAKRSAKKPAATKKTTSAEPASIAADDAEAASKAAGSAAVATSKKKAPAAVPTAVKKAAARAAAAKPATAQDEKASEPDKTAGVIAAPRQSTVKPVEAEKPAAKDSEPTAAAAPATTAPVTEKAEAETAKPATKTTATKRAAKPRTTATRKRVTGTGTTATRKCSTGAATKAAPATTEKTEPESASTAVKPEPAAAKTAEKPATRTAAKPSARKSTTRSAAPKAAAPKVPASKATAPKAAAPAEKTPSATDAKPEEKPATKRVSTTRSATTRRKRS